MYLEDLMEYIAPSSYVQVLTYKEDGTLLNKINPIYAGDMQVETTKKWLVGEIRNNHTCIQISVYCED